VVDVQAAGVVDVQAAGEHFALVSDDDTPKTGSARPPSEAILPGVWTRWSRCVTLSVDLLSGQRRSGGRLLTPQYLDQVRTESNRYGSTGEIERPPQIPKAGYVTFLDPGTEALTSCRTASRTLCS
jgi:hypothetical protein